MSLLIDLLLHQRCQLHTLALYELRGDDDDGDDGGGDDVDDNDDDILFFSILQEARVSANVQSDAPRDGQEMIHMINERKMTKDINTKNPKQLTNPSHEHEMTKEMNTE